MRSKSRNVVPVHLQEYQHMTNNLHEMLKSLGEEEIEGHGLKMDEFELLRVEFVRAAEQYEVTNDKLKVGSNKTERARQLLDLFDNKNSMERCLKQMLNITKKLHDKVEREREREFTPKTISNKTQAKGKMEESEQSIDEPLLEANLDNKNIEMSPLEQELYYKNMIVYSCQQSYFKIIKTENSSANKFQKDRDVNKYNSLEDLRERAKMKELVEQPDEVHPEEKEFIAYLKSIDSMIEERISKVLEGVKVLHRNAVHISESLDTVHMKVLVNLDKATNNLEELKVTKQRLDEAAESVSKPNCCMNVVIVILLALVAYLVIRIVWLPSES